MRFQVGSKAFFLQCFLPKGLFAHSLLKYGIKLRYVYWQYLLGSCTLG